MRIRSFAASLMLSAVAMLIQTQNVSAAFVFNVEQVGASVVITGSGSLNTAALSAYASRPDNSEIYPIYGLLSVGVDASATGYSTISGPPILGQGGEALIPTSDSGDHVGVGYGVSLVVPYGYASGSALSDTDTYSGYTFASLGLTPGVYNYNWGSGSTADSLTINIGPQVPEPASAAVVALPATLALLRRRRARVIRNIE